MISNLNISIVDISNANNVSGVSYNISGDSIKIQNTHIVINNVKANSNISGISYSIYNTFRLENVVVEMNSVNGKYVYGVANYTYE